MLAGQEIGTANLGPEYDPEAYIDLEGNNVYNEILETRGGDESQRGDIIRELQLKARDHGRLPMQWNDAPNAGFTSPDAKPWMTANKDDRHSNVASQVDDPDSIMAFWKRLLALRKEYADLLVYGTYTPFSQERTGEVVLEYERRSTEQKTDAEEYEDCSVLMSNQEAGVEDGVLALVPFRTIVLYKK